MVKIGVGWGLVIVFLCHCPHHGQSDANRSVPVKTSMVADKFDLEGWDTGTFFLPPFFSFQRPEVEGQGKSGNDTETPAGARSVNGQGYVEDSKGGGIEGLPFGNTANPLLVQLRKGLQPNKEPDCVRTYFMGPYANSITFSANASVGSREDPTCIWNFIGTEPCIPLLTCTEFNLLDGDNKCKDYLEVYDGYLGLERFCTNKGPFNISAYGGLRDLYLKYQALKPEPGAPDKVKLTCTVTCSERGDGKYLTKAFEPKTSVLCQCGKRPNQDRIVNGENSTKHEWPWMAALVRSRTRQPYCGASIINDRTLLTAAHCFQGDFLQLTNIEVLLGGNLLDTTPNFAVWNQTERPLPKTYDTITLTELDSQNGSLRYGVDEVIVHPLFVSKTNDFDVAVIKLSGSIDFVKFPHLSPVCLPKLGSYLRTYAKRIGTVTGWGRQGENAPATEPILQKLNITIYTPKECKATYFSRVNRRMMCAGYPEGGKDSCMGDSGGPLVLEEVPHLWHLVGIVSWGEGCAKRNLPGAYLRVTEISQWVHYHSNVNSAVWCDDTGLPSPPKQDAT